ncbi:MAG TPA: efflux transporter outer membrane subunit [Thermoanaerobaculales bacterium]|nr:efflux transporter outer membrane subunit [Thermoanaerobaculales bacterium]HQL29854.1 efflux transporter outer membrane subunit [Thermoanaerobaculales bacterium]
MRPRLLVLAAAGLALAACTMIPPYERPQAPVPADWSGPAVEPTPAPSSLPASEVPWSEALTDRRLRSVVELALANNRDLRIAALNVDRVRSLYQIQRSELYPAVGAMASGDVYRLPASMSESGRSKTVEQYSVQLGTLSWELDFFGRIRSLEASALEQYLATEQARAAAHISLVAAVASSYLALAADVESLAISQATLAAYRESAELIRHSRDAGVASDLDLAQVSSQVDAARAAVAAFSGRVATGRNALELLAGAPVPTDLLPDALTTVTELAELAAGLPSEALLSRPDILAAEHQLIAANARIGAARAAFFPSISLTAGAGTMSADLSGLFGAGSGTWTFSPQILAPIFASGSLRANLRTSELDREIALVEYEKAIQGAFREVSDGLTLRSTLREQRAAEETLVQDLERAVRLSDARYQAGIDSYLAVLIAERSLFAAQQSLVNVRLAEQVNLLNLYKALGGGGPIAGPADQPSDPSGGAAAGSAAADRAPWP